MAFTSFEREYVMGDLKLYREFDNSHFISNAKSAVTGKIQAVNLKMKFDYYSSMLAKAISDFVGINIEKDSITEFLTHFDTIPKLDAVGLTARDIDQCDVTTFKPQYLAQYTTMVQVIIDKVLQDSITEDEIVRIIAGEYPEKVERQIVKTTLKYGVTPKELLGENVRMTKADTTYVKTKVIPYVAGYQQLKDSTLAEANALLNAIKESEDTIKAMHIAIEKIKHSGNLSFEKVQKLNQVSFNALRGLIDIISYVTFMMIRKMNSISSKAISCEKLYNDITNLYADENFEEGAIDKNLFATDTNSLAEEMLAGQIDPYSALATNMFDFYANVPSADLVEDIPVYAISDTDDFMRKGINDQLPTMLDKFSNIAKAYLSISTGLDVIAKEGDEYLMIFDDIMNESGFTMPIETRFKQDIDAIKDMTDYNTAVDGPNADMFKRALTEVKSYANNMQVIANISAEVYKKIKVISERYTRNINNEYSDVETINELKIFLTGFLDQYESMSRTIARNFYDRLKALGQILSEVSDAIHGGGVEDSNTPMVNDSQSTLDAMDFTEMAFDSIMNDIEEESALYFRALESSYYEEKEMALRGVKVVLEADQPATTQPAQAPDATPSANTANSTKVVVQDNNPEAKASSGNGGALAKLKADIGEFITGIVEKFKAVIKKSSVKNTAWLSENRAELENRSYNNVTVNILPYSNIPAQKIVEDIGKLASAVKAMTPQNMQAITKKNDLYTKLFTFISGGVKEETGPLNDQILKYYKVGTAELKTVPVANGELKTQITTVMIPFCVDFAEKYENSIETALKTLADAVDTTIKSYGGGQSTEQPVKESVSIFMEAEESNKNTEGNISDKANWMREVVKTFSGAILNAIRDRNQDYLKVLSSLTPKTPVKPAQNSNTNTANANQANANTQNQNTQTAQA